MAPFMSRNCHAIIDRMTSHPISLKQSFKIVLIGSGGAQACCGSQLVARCSQITVLSLGGFCQHGFNVAERVYHLRPSRLGLRYRQHCVPSRWPSTVGSAFNQARLQGDYTALMVPTISLRHGANGTIRRQHSNKVNQLPIWSVQNLTACVVGERGKMLKLISCTSYWDAMAYLTASPPATALRWSRWSYCGMKPKKLSHFCNKRSSGPHSYIRACLPNFKLVKTLSRITW